MSPRGSFYGGAGLALACAMMEQATGRDAVWCTVQFASGAAHGDHLSSTARWWRTATARRRSGVTARVDGREVFTSVGATGAAAGRTSRTFAPMPDVSPPEESVRNSVPAAFDPLRRRTSAPPSSARPSSTVAPKGARPPAWPSGRASTGSPGWTPDAAGVRRRHRAHGDPSRARRPPTRGHEPRQLLAGRAPGRIRVAAARDPRRGRARGLRARLGPPLVTRRYPRRRRQPDLRRPRSA